MMNDFEFILRSHTHNGNGHIEVKSYHNVLRYIYLILRKLLQIRTIYNCIYKCIELYCSVVL